MDGTSQELHGRYKIEKLLREKFEKYLPESLPA
jgi:hypothetical protein